MGRHFWILPINQVLELYDEVGESEEGDKYRKQWAHESLNGFLAFDIELRHTLAKYVESF